MDLRIPRIGSSDRLTKGSDRYGMKNAVPAGGDLCADCGHDMADHRDNGKGACKRGDCQKFVSTFENDSSKQFKCAGCGTEGTITSSPQYCKKCGREVVPLDHDPRRAGFENADIGKNPLSRKERSLTTGRQRYGVTNADNIRCPICMNPQTTFDVLEGHLRSNHGVQGVDLDVIMKDERRMQNEGQDRSMHNIGADVVRTIEAILSNDEASSDDELVRHFVREMGLSESDARAWVRRRNPYLKSI